MTSTDQAPAVDMDKLMEFVFRAVGEVGATLNTALVVMGDQLGLYRALAGAGPLSPADLADRTGTAERYVREWLNAQAAGGFVNYDPDSGRYTLPPEQAMALTDETARPTCPASSRSRSARCSTRRGSPRRAQTGAGYRLARARPRRSRGMRAFLPARLQRAPDRRVAARARRRGGKLESGAHVADVGCGHGASTILMAQAFPNSTFTGSDYHDGSIETARRQADKAGRGRPGPVRDLPGGGYSGTGYDLVTMFDCLHDMGDPVGAARHVLSTLKPDGTWMIVEPIAGDRVEDNLNPVGRAYYAFSTLLCTPASLSQDVGLALGAQAGEARIRDVVKAGGFTRFRRVAETPFNIVYEARP